MKKIHVECLPDEALVKKLGFTRKMVTHHSGKGRVFHNLKSETNQLAMVDEDPESAKTHYEKNLTFVNESHGIKLYTDKSDNKIIFLKGKLEDWIVALSYQSRIVLSDYGLPEKPNDLHDVINQRLSQFENLIEHLLKINNPHLKQLKEWLN
jgi:hypothetical protein